jgi:hypothetical protein
MNVVLPISIQAYVEIFARRKVLITSPALTIFIMLIFLSRVNDCIEDMGTFIALVFIPPKLCAIDTKIS